MKEPKPWARARIQFLEEVMPDLRLDGKLSWIGCCTFQGRGTFTKYVCFLLILFVGKPVIFVILITE